MGSDQSRHHYKRAYSACGLLLVSLFYAQAQKIGGDAPALVMPQLLEPALASLTTHRLEDPSSLLMREDPLAYWNQARENYRNSVRDYTCLFAKQEVLGDRLSDEQVAEIKFREGPFSVFMHIIKNPARARRVLYVKDKFMENGQEQVVVEPESPIARLFVQSVLRPITGAEAQKQSRRSISEFGFARSLDLIIKYAQMTKQQGLLNVRFVGEGRIDGRPTHVFERRLPFKKDNSTWPDALLIVHMDQEWQLPVACYSYANPDGTQLLGKYVYTRVNLNVGLQPADFEPGRCGL